MSFTTVISSSLTLVRLNFKQDSRSLALSKASSSCATDIVDDTFLDIFPTFEIAVGVFAKIKNQSDKALSDNPIEKWVQALSVLRVPGDFL
jgi:hypothetical protein